MECLMVKFLQKKGLKMFIYWAEVLKVF